MLLATALFVCLVAFAGGLYLVARFVPLRREGESQRFAGRVVDALGGATTAVAALHGFLAVRYATTTNGSIPGWGVAEVVADELIDALWQSGVLLAVMTVICLVVDRRTPTTQ